MKRAKKKKRNRKMIEILVTVKSISPMLMHKFNDILIMTKGQK